MSEMREIFHLVYVSTAREAYDRSALDELLIQARSRNERLNITGLLIYGDETFIQALEGRRGLVSDVYESIKRDARHHQVITLLEFTDTERDFPDWTMAFTHEPDRERIKRCITLLKEQREDLAQGVEIQMIRRLLTNIMSSAIET
ncbi:BLUF domain-containing protein [Thalassobaculum sp.]|uniref:BLUF domain-containing protein n=1 Tax=Thalassobaculum sp. TaxID=2022740 RepID=UPI0032ECD9AA